MQVTTDPCEAKPANEATTPSEAKPAKEVTTDFGQPISPQTAQQDRATSACEPYRELIEQGLGRGRNAMAIWQGLVSGHGFPHGYLTVKRFVRKLRGAESPQVVGIILTAAGEEAQVDYGSGPMVRDPQSGKYRRTRLFVLTLGYSRKSVRLLVWRSSARIWAEIYEKAFRRLGACARVVVLDFVPGNKIQVMCRSPLCALQPRNVVVGREADALGGT
jgi:transposase